MLAVLGRGHARSKQTSQREELSQEPKHWAHWEDSPALAPAPPPHLYLQQRASLKGGSAHGSGTLLCFFQCDKGSTVKPGRPTEASHLGSVSHRRARSQRK